MGASWQLPLGAGIVFSVMMCVALHVERRWAREDAMRALERDP